MWLPPGIKPTLPFLLQTQGILLYYQGQFEAAIDRFVAARDLSDLIAREHVDPIARKNSACCHNNIGVCCQMLGRRAEAVQSYRSAVTMLKATSGLQVRDYIAINYAWIRPPAPCIVRTDPYSSFWTF